MDINPRPISTPHPPITPLSSSPRTRPQGCTNSSSEVRSSAGFPDDSDVDGEQSPSSPSLIPFSYSGAPPHALGTLSFAGNQAQCRGTEAPHRTVVSSRSSPPSLEEIDDADHAFDITVTSCTPFTCSPASGRSRTPPESPTWPLPRRKIRRKP
jgi:hypothetical protein